jgi:hypothetical protein
LSIQVSFHPAGAVPTITRDEQPSELKTGIRLARLDLQLFDASHDYQSSYDDRPFSPHEVCVSPCSRSGGTMLSRSLPTV